LTNDYGKRPPRFRTVTVYGEPISTMCAMVISLDPSSRFAGLQAILRVNKIEIGNLQDIELTQLQIANRHCAKVAGGF
jgi:hypothetical protein